MNYADQDDIDESLPEDMRPLSRAELVDICDQIALQPAWRTKADKEMDYCDGNQLDSELLRRQAALGIPPAVENIMQPTIEAIQGMEEKTRTDWRLTADGGLGGQDVADALNYKLNQAERASKADAACSEAFKTQLCVGIGWVEVSRESDPTKFPYRCNAVHRNEIHWDMSEPGDLRLKNNRWLLRRRWMHPDRLAMVFPQHKAQIKLMGSGGHGYDDYGLGVGGLNEGGASTGLNDAHDQPRGMSINEQRWFDPLTRQVCVFEVWYRRWVTALFMRTPDGRVVEFDNNNPGHVAAVATRVSTLQRATVSRMRRSYWLGPLRLHDGLSPYSHDYYPYVPFWGKREDATGVPYGVLRHMMYSQETLNSAISKLRWGMSAVRTERTKGAVQMTDAQFRDQVGRVDADIVLDPVAMAQQGARFEVKRDYQLTEQHYKMTEDARQSIERVGPGSSAFLGKVGTARSGIQEQTQAEQSNQRLAALMGQFKEGRTVVGEILVSLIIEDLGNEKETVVIEGDAIRKPRTVTLNAPEVDPITGQRYLSNDVQRTRLKVALDDVPTSSSFRAQQLSSLTEAVKSMPAEMQAALTPFLVALMDLPYKKEVVEAVRAAGAGASEQDIEKRIQEAVKAAGLELKERERALKYSPEMIEAQVRKLVAETFKLNGGALYEAIQTANTLAMNPAAAPLADHTARIAGFIAAPGGQDPNFPVEGLPQPTAMPPAPAPGSNGASGPMGTPNVDPTEPPAPPRPPGPSTGIETQRTDGVPLSGQGFQPRQQEAAAA